MGEIGDSVMSDEEVIQGSEQHQSDCCQILGFNTGLVVLSTLLRLVQHQSRLCSGEGLTMVKDAEIAFTEWFDLYCGGTRILTLIKVLE